MVDPIETSRSRLVDGLAAVLGEVEDMLKRAAGETGERAKDLRAQVDAKLLAAKLQLEELHGVATGHAKDAARATDEYVHGHPWQAVGVAAAVGFVVGLLVSRR